MSCDKSLSHINRLLPVQGPDPITDEGHGLQLGRRFGIYGFSPFPKPVANFLRTKVFAPLLIDPTVDTVFMEKVFMWSLLMVPLWVYLLTTCDYVNHPYWFAACGVLHTLLWLDQFETYVLGLHCVVHRPVWRPGKVADAFKAYWVWVLGPMLGETPETYRAHHVMMHHPRNNGYDDLSTTMTYRRDGLWDFMRYLGRFLIVHFELYDTLKTSHTKVARRFLWGEICWMSIGLALYWTRPLPAICFYFLPIMFLRIGMTCGNWGQHAFINDADPFSNFNQSTTIVNSVYNTKAFNDGYHIMHHQYPQAHYTDLPKHFVAMLPELAEHDSVVFDARGGFGPICDWPSIWWLLMSGQYGVLADHFVDCRQLADATGKTPRRSKEEIITLLKSRTCKVYNRAVDGENPNKRAGGSRAARVSAAGEVSGASEDKKRD